MSRFTDQEKLEAAEREVKFRQRVYAKRVAAKSMSPEAAERQLGLMKEIADDYRAKVELGL